MALTKRQKEVLDFLANFVETNGFSPSYEEVAKGLDLASLATVHKHVSALEAKQYLRRSYNQSRSLEVTARYFEETGASRGGTRELFVPLLGRIAAGAPVESFVSEEKLAFTDFVGNPDTFALQVRGNSMIEDHICDGDFVLIHRSNEARDGEIVVALVDGVETTLKRYYRENDGIVRLQPANAAMQPILAPAGSVQVQGKVLAVLRKYK